MRLCSKCQHAQCTSMHNVMLHNTAQWNFGNFSYYYAKKEWIWHPSMMGSVTYNGNTWEGEMLMKSLVMLLILAAAWCCYLLDCVIWDFRPSCLLFMMNDFGDKAHVSPFIVMIIVGAVKSPYKVTTFFYVAAKATYIRLLHGKIGFLGFFRPYLRKKRSDPYSASMKYVVCLHLYIPWKFGERGSTPRGATGPSLSFFVCLSVTLRC